MMFSLPDPDVLYDALVARSDAYEGRAYVGVTSTGIFCRLNCPAPNPKPENCTFFEPLAIVSLRDFDPANAATHWRQWRGWIRLWIRC